MASISTSFDDLENGVTAAVPSAVTAGSTFQVALTPDPIDVPTSGGGFAIQNLNNVRVRFAVPAGAEFVSATLSGGANLGSGTPTVSQTSPGVVTLVVPGQLAPGSTAVLPTVTATLMATGAPGTVLDSRLSGSSYNSPSISFNAVVRVLFANVTGVTNCYAPANPVVASTTIN